MGIGDKVEAGTNTVIRLMVTALWGLVAVGAFSSGAPLVGVGAIAYLGYVWLLGGRLMIY